MAGLVFDASILPFPVAAYVGFVPPYNPRWLDSIPSVLHIVTKHVRHCHSSLCFRLLGGLKLVKLRTEAQAVITSGWPAGALSLLGLPLP